VSIVDETALGRTGEPFELDLERGKIREFARATRSANPDYLSAGNPVIPATFLTTMAFWAGPESDPWSAVRMDLTRGLHAEQEFVFHGPPPRAGTRLTAVSRVTEMYTKQGRRGGALTFAVMVTEFRDAAGRLVAEAKLTGVETAHLDPTVATASSTVEAL
jgi:N-terminal half of MaoC dehydratase